LVRVTFSTLLDGAEHAVEIAAGLSLMEGAKAHRVPGIEAACGGSMACGTCHVHVDDAWFGRLPPMGDTERAVLDFAIAPSATSRLACQVRLTDDLDGLRVTVPAAQL
jgi:2Fe-2S ferredoxin